MKKQAAFKFIRTGMMGCLLAAFLAGVAPAQTNDPGASNAAGLPPESPSTQELLRSYLQIQEQLHSVELANERDRQEAKAAATQQTDMLEGRLAKIETALVSQRADLSASNQLVFVLNRLVLILIVVGVFTLVAFLFLLIAFFRQSSVMSRMVAAVSLPALGGGQVPNALGMGEGALLGTGSAEQSTARFLAAIERLEKRILEMEHARQAQPSLAETSHANGDAEVAAHYPGTETNGGSAPAPKSEPAAQITVMLGKGQTLLKMDQAEGALACFDEVLAIDPTNAEALVKKGAALERLQRLDEAVACYDLAIATGKATTMAYLYKGGVFNRLERYNEALECYEKALKTQENGRAIGHN